MASMVVQLLGFFLGLLGFFGTVVTTVMPHWRRTVSVGSSALTDTAYMKGLWIECVWHSTGVYLCEVHQSLLDLPRDLQAARALMVLSCISSTLATALSSVGMKCTSCVRDSPVKTALALSGGVCYLSAGLLCLVTVSWTTNDVIRDFYNHLVPNMRYEIGQAIYVGFISAVLSITGGAVLCLSCRGSKKHLPYQPETHIALQQFTPTPEPGYQPLSVDIGNDAPRVFSASGNGYKLNDYV